MSANPLFLAEDALRSKEQSQDQHDECGHVLEFGIDDERRPVDGDTHHQRPHECALRRAEPAQCHCGENEQQDASTNIPLDGVEPEECA